MRIFSGGRVGGEPGEGDGVVLLPMALNSLHL